ncbi:MAG: FHA domain-containing protein, partial [Nannocystaceae bacterium]|nr:FHA domain-containing protein [Nannocystaceae bacterium]
MRHNGYRLLVLTGELRGREIDVLSETITVGKSRSCDVVLPDDSVSRVHAEIRREGDAYRLRDRGSTNGSYVGGARVTDAYLKPGDVLGVGKVQPVSYT